MKLTPTIPKKLTPKTDFEMTRTKQKRFGYWKTKANLTTRMTKTKGKPTRSNWMTKRIVKRMTKPTPMIDFVRMKSKASLTKDLNWKPILTKKRKSIPKNSKGSNLTRSKGLKKIPTQTNLSLRMPKNLSLRKSTPKKASWKMIPIRMMRMMKQIQIPMTKKTSC